MNRHARVDLDSHALASTIASGGLFACTCACAAMLRPRHSTILELLRRGARCFSHGWCSSLSPPLMPQRRVVVTGMPLHPPFSPLGRFNLGLEDFILVGTPYSSCEVFTNSRGNSWKLLWRPMALTMLNGFHGIMVSTS